MFVSRLYGHCFVQENSPFFPYVFTFLSSLTGTAEEAFLASFFFPLICCPSPAAPMPAWLTPPKA
jgi:hypothetical protein